MSVVADIQRILGVKADGVWGKVSQAALDAAVSNGRIHRVKASSFADPADVRAFKKCKATGKSDQECFRVGDNGIGKWGDDTTADRPMVALPPEDWQPFGERARGKQVIVATANKHVIAELRDTMPRRANIKNGAGIDLNPAACAALGLTPPVMADVTWQWA